MVDQLVVPDHLSRPDIEADQAVRVKVLAGTVAAIDVVGRGLDIQIDIAQLRVHGERPPDTGVPRVIRRAVVPGFVARLAFAGNGVEDPLLFACAHIERHHIATHVALILAAAAGSERGSDYNGVVRDHDR